jgi:hypothetical protein
VAENWKTKMQEWSGLSDQRSFELPLPNDCYAQIADLAIYCGLVPFERSIMVRLVDNQATFKQLIIEGGHRIG